MKYKIQFSYFHRSFAWGKIFKNSKQICRFRSKHIPLNLDKIEIEKILSDFLAKNEFKKIPIKLLDIAIESTRLCEYKSNYYVMHYERKAHIYKKGAHQGFATQDFELLTKVQNILIKNPELHVDAAVVAARLLK